MYSWSRPWQQLQPSPAPVSWRSSLRLRIGRVVNASISVASLTRKQRQTIASRVLGKIDQNINLIRLDHRFDNRITHFSNLPPSESVLANFICHRIGPTRV